MNDGKAHAFARRLPTCGGSRAAAIDAERRDGFESSRDQLGNFQMIMMSAKSLKSRVFAVLSFVALAVVAVPAAAGEATDTYPGENWQMLADPGAAGWSAEGLTAARRLSQQIGSAAVMIVQDGRVVAEWGQTSAEFNVYSIRKSLLSALIGIQVGLGRIDLDRTVGELGIEARDPPLSTAERRATVADLLTARSGIYRPAAYETDDMVARRPARGCHPPGTYWYYNNWDFNALGTIFEQQTGRGIAEAFAEQIARPLGMQDFDVEDVAYAGGRVSLHPAYLFVMSARDLARFGLLYLRQGHWRDGQVVPADWVRDSTATQTRAGSGRGYGYMWWTERRSGMFPYVNLPKGSFAASGNRGQKVLVVPAHDLVIVHLIDSGGRERATSAQLGRLLRTILDAGGIPYAGDGAQRSKERRSPGLDDAEDAARYFTRLAQPADLKIQPPADDVPADLAGFSGKWVGVWSGGRKHLLAVERVDRDFGVVVYSQAARRATCIDSGDWFRVRVSFADGALTFPKNWPAKVSYRANADGTLTARIDNGRRVRLATMRRVE